MPGSWFGRIGRQGGLATRRVGGSARSGPPSCGTGQGQPPKQPSTAVVACSRPPVWDRSRKNLALSARRRDDRVGAGPLTPSDSKPLVPCGTTDRARIGGADPARARNCAAVPSVLEHCHGHGHGFEGEEHEQDEQQIALCDGASEGALEAIAEAPTLLLRYRVEPYTHQERGRRQQSDENGVGEVQQIASPDLVELGS